MAATLRPLLHVRGFQLLRNSGFGFTAARYQNTTVFYGQLMFVIGIVVILVGLVAILLAPLIARFIWGLYSSILNLGERPKAPAVLGVRGFGVLAVLIGTASLFIVGRG